MARLNRHRPDVYARVFGRAVRCLALYINNNNVTLRAFTSPVVNYKVVVLIRLPL